MRRHGILVLGMHRSGTSALTGLLVHLGVRAPHTLIAANEHNQLGYWESAPFVAFHDRLLHAVGTDWDLWTRVPAGGLDPVAAQFGEEFRALFEREFDSAPLFVMKDPRVCRLVPFWLHHLASANVEPAAILMVRSPLEVAQSLAARDHIGLEQALLLWLRHVLDAEFETRGIGRSVVQFEDLLRDWEAVARRISEDIGVQWSIPSAATRLTIATFLKSDLRHHAIGLESLEVAPQLSDWVRQTHAALQQLVAPDGGSVREASRMFDQVREAFDRFSVVFGPPVQEERHARLRHSKQLEADQKERIRYTQGVEKDRDELRQRALALEKDLDELRLRAVALEKDRARFERDAGEWRERALHAEVQRNQIEQSHDAVLAELDSVSGRLTTSDERIQALEQSRSWRWTAPIREALRILHPIARRRST